MENLTRENLKEKLSDDHFRHCYVSVLNKWIRDGKAAELESGDFDKQLFDEVFELVKKTS